MNTLSSILQSSRFNLYSGALMAIFFVFFASAHLTKFMDTGSLSTLLVIISETLVIFLFICRSNPKTVSINPYDWLVAIMGSFAPLFFRPENYGVLPQAEVLIILGATLQIAGLISLNRSFAIVAAKRQIKTKGMYGIIRHPIYASYFLLFGSYVLVHSSVANLVIFTIMMIFLCLRILREEAHLSHDPEYRIYIQRVRYRIIPSIF
ncbi:MAG: methyltransferase [Candidatus Nitrotoga sp.]|nr:methyltransferase [Candidatus Nitrotoga sp.]